MKCNKTHLGHQVVVLEDNVGLVEVHAVTTLLVFGTAERVRSVAVTARGLITDTRDLRITIHPRSLDIVTVMHNVRVREQVSHHNEVVHLSVQRDGVATVEPREECVGVAGHVGLIIRCHLAQERTLFGDIVFTIRLSSDV